METENQCQRGICCRRLHHRKLTAAPIAGSTSRNPRVVNVNHRRRLRLPLRMPLRLPPSNSNQWNDCPSHSQFWPCHSPSGCWKWQMPLMRKRTTNISNSKQSYNRASTNTKTTIKNNEGISIRIRISNHPSNRTEFSENRPPLGWKRSARCRSVLLLP